MLKWVGACFWGDEASWPYLLEHKEGWRAWLKLLPDTACWTVKLQNLQRGGPNTIQKRSNTNKKLTWGEKRFTRVSFSVKTCSLSLISLSLGFGQMTRQNSILGAVAGNTLPVKQAEARYTRFPGQDLMHGKQRCGSPFQFFQYPSSYIEIKTNKVWRTEDYFFSVWGALRNETVILFPLGLTNLRVV